MAVIEYPALPLDFVEFYALFILVMTTLSILYIIYRKYWPPAREWLREEAGR
jgi:hypothetical protein